jgi:predicted Holliday junction resolvase-like endonuclease
MDERDQMEHEKDELEREVTRLSTMSLVNFVADVQHKMEMNTMERDRAVKRAEQERELRKEAEQKFEFWDKMNHGVK